jgi:hypothetical protein
MEADWSVELLTDDPVIVVPWAAARDDSRKCEFVDLRLGGNVVDEIEEARNVPELRTALLLLNSTVSPLWTTKCDTWESDIRMDPYEMDAAPADTSFSFGSYIDLLAKDRILQASFDRQEQWVRAITETLRAVEARAARMELVLRRAQVDHASGYGVSWFVAGCGATAQRARQAWSEALGLALPVITNADLIQLRLRIDDDTMTESGE